MCLLWLLWCCGGSTANELKEGEWRIVVLLVVVFRVIFVLVVSLSRTCCLVVRFWLGCRSRGGGGLWVILVVRVSCL